MKGEPLLNENVLLFITETNKQKKLCKWTGPILLSKQQNECQMTLLNVPLKRTSIIINWLSNYIPLYFGCFTNTL